MSKMTDKPKIKKFSVKYKFRHSNFFWFIVQGGDIGRTFYLVLQFWFCWQTNKFLWRYLIVYCKQGRATHFSQGGAKFNARKIVSIGFLSSCQQNKDLDTIKFDDFSFKAQTHVLKSYRSNRVVFEIQFTQN